MRSSTALAAASLALCLGTAQAATPTATDDKPADGRSAQQNRMKTCSADAKVKELKGADRKSFMSDCLKKKA